MRESTRSRACVTLRESASVVSVRAVGAALRAAGTHSRMCARTHGIHAHAGMQAHGPFCHARLGAALRGEGRVEDFVDLPQYEWTNKKGNTKKERTIAGTAQVRG